MIIDVCPTVDFAFKLMLGSPEHTAVTVHFLNAVLDSGPRITQATILNPFLGKETADGNLSVLEIKARDELGRYLNIEVQTSAANGLRQRFAYYAGRLYVDQMREGMEYWK
ncbi:MAG: Rpn family recombination-promoting nuclease/putative transposase [Planctomycetota bacterium]